MSEPVHVALGPGGEFDLIRRLERIWGDLAVGLGDDAAVVDVPVGERLVVSTDTSVDGVHFRQEWVSLYEVGYRSTQAALSDLAAMAARPLGIFLGITLPSRDAAVAEALAAGIGGAARDAGTVIRGGDLTAGAALSLCVTVIGAAAVPLRRDTAYPGLGLYVTGRLGGPGRAVAEWMRGGTPDAWSRSRFAAPRARLEEARWLADAGAVAALDISDGLGSELRHLSAASGVRIVCHAEQVPRGPDVSALEALASGEEYELLCAAPRLDLEAFTQRFGLPLTRIGEVTAGDPDVIVMHGERRVDLPMGHDHFSL